MRVRSGHDIIFSFDKNHAVDIISIMKHHLDFFMGYEFKKNSNKTSVKMSNMLCSSG